MNLNTELDVKAYVELSDLVARYCNELDLSGGSTVVEMFTEDCYVDVGTMQFKCRDEMADFYAQHSTPIASDSSAPRRITRHTFTNFRLTELEEERATLTFIVVNYSAHGVIPVPLSTTPTVVTDVVFDCIRSPEGKWKIREFRGLPVFLGNDPVVNKALSKSSGLTVAS